MTNEQLGVLLFHLMRQINVANGEVLRELGLRGIGLDPAEQMLMPFTGIAKALEQQALLLGAS